MKDSALNSTVDDIVLARRSSRGDRDAFSELCERKQSDLIFYCLSMLGNHHDAEDAAQQTVLSMWLNIRRLDRPEGFRAWMLHIAHNKCLDMLRARGRRADYETEADAEQAEVREQSADAIPEKYAENAELSEALYQMILTLPEKRRETVLLYYYESLSTVEIAKITGLTPGSVQGALSKARAQLLAMIKEKEGFAELAGRSGMVPIGSMMGAQVPMDTVLKEALHKSSLAHVDAARLEAFSKGWQNAIANVRPRASLGAAKIAWTAAAACAAVLLLTVLTPGTNTKAEVATKTVAITTAPVNDEIQFVGDCSCGHINPSLAELSGPGVTDQNTVWEIFAGAIGTADTSAPPLSTGAGSDATAQIVAMKTAGQLGNYTLRFRTPDPVGTAYYSRVFTIE